MDIVTFALCKKLASGGATSEEAKQQIEEIKGIVSQLEDDYEVYNTKLQDIESKVKEVQTDTILAELREVRTELSKKVSVRIVE